MTKQINLTNEKETDFKPTIGFCFGEISKDQDGDLVGHFLVTYENGEVYRHDYLYIMEEGGYLKIMDGAMIPDIENHFHLFEEAVRAAALTYDKI